MPLILDKKQGQEIPLRPTRMGDYQIGDTVQARYSNYVCTGVIVDINPLIQKIMVDFGGILSQVQPDQIAYVPYYNVIKNLKQQSNDTEIANQVYQHYLRQENL